MGHDDGEELQPAKDEDVLHDIRFALGRLTEFRSKIAGAADTRRSVAARKIFEQLKLSGFRVFRKPPLGGHGAGFFKGRSKD